jgi:hypothetical protein
MVRPVTRARHVFLPSLFGYHYISDTIAGSYGPPHRRREDLTPMSSTPDLRYPIGPLVYREHLSAPERQAAIAVIAATPDKLREAVSGLSDAQLDTPYRPGGWTVRQLVHHVPDSHLHAYTRCKLALTEDEPTIRPFDEACWNPDCTRSTGCSRPTPGMDRTMWRTSRRCGIGKGGRGRVVALCSR